MPPRVLFLITDLDLGGSPRMLRDLVLGLRAYDGGKAFEPVVCSIAPPGVVADEIVRGSQEGGGGGVAVYGLDGRSPRDLPAVLARYRTLLRRLQPQLVCSILIHANLVATIGRLFHRCPVVHAIHTLQPRPAWHWWLQGAIARYAAGVVAPSQAILDRIARYGTFEHGRVIPNGIDVDRFATAVEAEPRPWGPGSLVVGYIGRFDPVKRLDRLIGAVALLRARQMDVKLTLVGYGRQEEALRQLATMLHIAPHVHFAGPTSEPERWYKTFDIHCLPSSVEGFGLTLVESLAAGVPVVAVESPATRAIVRPGRDGLLVEGGTETSLADGIQVVAQRVAGGGWDPAASQQHVRRMYGVESMIAQHAKILQVFLQ